MHLNSSKQPEPRPRVMKTWRERAPRNKSASDRHLWQIFPAWDLIVLSLIALFVWLVYELREILIPLLVALVLAYIFNPLVMLLEHKWHQK